MKVYKICVLHTNRDFFDYYAEDDIKPCIGARVWVPFRNKVKLGIVVGESNNNGLERSLKSIISLIDDFALLSDSMLAMCRWVGQYYQSPLSEVLALALPKKYRLGDACKLPMCEAFSLKDSYTKLQSQISIRSVKQHQLLDFINSFSHPVSKKELQQAGFSTSQINILVERDFLIKHNSIDKPIIQCDSRSEPLALNDEQALALSHISEHLTSYHCFLLQGVTGSGKTEVYLQIIAKTLAMGRQVLILVPEIGLTPQLLTRFSARFKESMLVMHSNLNDTERQRAWQLAADNHVQLVIGTRSAIFTPMPALGLIVIDEEHDASLKQMEGVRYFARDTALMRAHAANIPIILGSATPSLESLYNCSLKKYTLLRLNQKALSSEPLHYQIVDIRNQTLKEGLAPFTLASINEHLSQGNQVLVFINRRGFSPILLCHQCGWMADCRACDTHLTVHRAINKLICHHCGLTEPIRTQCMSCKSHEIMPIGVGTQRVYEYLSSHFPTTSILRVDRDEVSKKNAMHEHLNLIHTGDAQLIVGTQMLAKGHHFPRLTLVVVLDVDNGFYNQDFRALERLGQLLLQVAGRAGRAEFRGEVLIQTHLPQHPMLNTLIQEGYETFAQSLLTTRQQASLPPYHFLALLRAQSLNKPKLLTFMREVKEKLQQSQVTVLGPAPAPLARKASQHRMQLMVKSSSRKTLHAALTPLREWLMNNKLSSGVRWNIDVDPMDLS